MNKNIIIGIVVVILVAGGIYWFMQSQNSASNTSPYGTTATSSPTPAAAPAANPPPAPTTNPSLAPGPTSLPPQTSAPAVHNVTIQNFSFNPSSITVKKGDTVIWTNKDPMGHTVTGNNGGPSSQTVDTNATYSYTFNSIGTFPYHCSIHPSMTGTVTVTQ